MDIESILPPLPWLLHPPLQLHIMLIVDIDLRRQGTPYKSWSHPWLEHLASTSARWIRHKYYDPTRFDEVIDN